LPRRPITQRLASPAVKEQEPRPGSRQPPGRTLHRVAPRADTAPPAADARLEDYTPLLRSLTAGPLSWPRSLILSLILLALLPNLTVIALLWFPAARSYWSEPAPPPAVEAAAPPTLPMTDNVRLAPPAAEKVGPVLTAPSTLEATAGDDVAFPLELDGTDGVPVRSTVAISGLPPGTSLSNGRPYGATGWNLKADEIGDLHLVLAGTFAGETSVRVQLIAPDGAVLAAADTALKVAPNPAAASPAPAAEVVADVAGAPASDPTAAPPQPAAPAPATAAADADVFPNEAATKPADATTDVAAVSPEQPSPKSSSKPATVGTPNTEEEDDGSFITPSEYVNLRDGPSSSSKVIGVVPEGTKLKVLARKRRWVQVTNPDTAESGWIYGRYVDGLPGGSGGAAKRPRRAKDSSDSDSDESMWTRFSNWLTGS
jgi:Bacterial SH3 domain